MNLKFRLSVVKTGTKARENVFLVIETAFFLKLKIGRYCDQPGFLSSVCLSADKRVCDWYTVLDIQYLLLFSVAIEAFGQECVSEK